MKFFINIKNYFISLIALFTVLAILPGNAISWYQDTHEVINEKSLDMFFSNYSEKDKYENSPVMRASSIDPANYLGHYITSNSKFQKLPWSYYDGFITEAPFDLWVRRGGYSADEPHFWASVRHFYDPLKVSGGKSELTDHNWIHGWFYEAVCAREWAFSHEENPFSWKKALEYYKKAMEIPEDDEMKVVPGINDGVSAFRDPAMNVKSNEEARSVYLAKSFRSLGETMHLMADMVCPPHVRNDSHPRSDPHEDSVRAAEARKILNGEYTGGEMLVLEGVRNQLDGVSAEMIFHRLAVFTNGNFYSNDTIYDEKSGINPRNGENPYPNPQLENLSSSLFIGENAILGREFEGHRVPMLRETPMNNWLRNLPVVGRNARHPYFIAPEDAIKQSALLIPLATHANMLLTDMLFPTMELFHRIEIVSVSPTDETVTYSLNGKMVHDIEKDPEWQRMEIEPVSYSGPGNLMVESDYGYSRKMGNLIFSEGIMSTYQPIFPGTDTPLGDIIDIKEKPLQYVFNSASSLYWTNNDLLLIPEGYSIYIEVKAGGRKFKSNAGENMIEFTGPVHGDLLITDDEGIITFTGLINLDKDEDDAQTFKDLKIYQYKHNKTNAFILEEVDTISWKIEADYSFSVECSLTENDWIVAVLAVAVTDNNDELTGTIFPGSLTNFSTTNDEETINWGINSINRIFPYGNPENNTYIFESPPAGVTREISLNASVVPSFWQSGHNFRLSTYFSEYHADGEMGPGYYARVSDADYFVWLSGEADREQLLSVSLTDNYQQENNIVFYYLVRDNAAVEVPREVRVSLIPFLWWNHEDVVIAYMKTK